MGQCATYTWTSLARYIWSKCTTPIAALQKWQNPKQRILAKWIIYSSKEPEDGVEHDGAKFHFWAKYTWPIVACGPTKIGY